MPYRLLLPSIAGIVLLVGGCAVDDDHDGHDDRTEDHAPVPPAADARVIAVVGADLAFDPDQIEVGAGEEVAIELTAADLEHDFVIDGTDTHIHADPGETTIGALRLDQAGTYTAYCSVPGHRAAGMVATVVVTD